MSLRSRSTNAHRNCSRNNGRRQRDKEGGSALGKGLGFSGKVVVITGSAQGIGRVMAEEFISAGASVVIADIQKEKGRQTVKGLCRGGGEAYFIATNLSREEDIAQMVRKTVVRFGRVDVLINNACPRVKRVPYEESLGDWDLAMEVILKASAQTVRHALPYLKKSVGQVINISSTNAYSISHQSVAYHVAKAGLLQLTRYLAHELGVYGIRVNAICPALVDVFEENRKPFSGDPDRKAVAEVILPFKKVPTAKAIAKAALFLSSDAAECITGQILTVDSGMTVADQFNVGMKAYRDKRSTV